MTNETLNQDTDDFNARDVEHFNAKHRRIRGSLEFKYPPLASACKSGCGLDDESVQRRDGNGHRCVLAIGHAGEHEWSWECGLMKGRVGEVV